MYHGRGQKSGDRQEHMSGSSQPYRAPHMSRMNADGRGQVFRKRRERVKQEGSQMTLSQGSTKTRTLQSTSWSCRNCLMHGTTLGAPEQWMSLCMNGSNRVGTLKGMIKGREGRVERVAY